VLSPEFPEVAVGWPLAVVVPFWFDGAGPFSPLLPWFQAGPEGAGWVTTAVGVLEALAGPVEPVLPELVQLLPSALPDWALEVVTGLAVAEPVVPPLPELPEVGVEFSVAGPVAPVDPVLPELPDCAVGAVGTLVWLWPWSWWPLQGL
jgi:hypothetical protein